MAIGNQLKEANEIEQFAQDIQKMDLYARSQKAIDHRKEDPLADVDFISSRLPIKRRTNNNRRDKERNGYSRKTIKANRKKEVD